MYFEYGTITHYGVGFQQLFLYIHFVTFLVNENHCLTTPDTASSLRFGLFPFRSPLLGEYRGIRHIVFFSSRY
jgi:hypothetical protein